MVIGRCPPPPPRNSFCFLMRSGVKRLGNHKYEVTTLHAAQPHTAAQRSARNQRPRADSRECGPGHVPAGGTWAACSSSWHVQQWRILNAVAWCIANRRFAIGIASIRVAHPSRKFLCLSCKLCFRLSFRSFPATRSLLLLPLLCCCFIISPCVTLLLRIVSKLLAPFRILHPGDS